MSRALGLREVEIRDIEAAEGVKLSQRQGRPLFMKGRCVVKGGRKPILFELDSGSDRCLIRLDEAKRLGVRIRGFKEPKNIVGVGGKLIKCEYFCILELDLETMNDGELKLNVLCYIFESNVPNLIGNDLMGYLGAVIDYREECVWLSGEKVKLWANKREAQEKCKRPVNFYAMADECLGAKECKKINVKLDGEPEGVFALMGNLESEILVMDAVYAVKQDRKQVIAINLSGEPRSMKAGECLGYVLEEGEGSEIISLDSLIADPVYFTKGMNDEHETKDDCVFEECGIGDLPDRRKLSAAQLDGFYQRGCKIERMSEGTRLEPNLVKEEISREKELAYSAECKAWESKEKFLEFFHWEDMKRELSEDVGEIESENFVKRLQELFWSYRAVFWNNRMTHWTKAKIPDLEIELIDNPPTAIDKYRTMSDEKQRVLKDYMSDLLKAGVIEKGTGATPYCCNPHVVKERRETSDGYVFKYRFCCDARHQNEIVKDISYRMPLIHELLRKASSGGKYFMSFDLSQYFFQLPISERSRQITSFYLLDWGIFQWTRCPMGLKSSPSQAQMTTDLVIRHMIRVLGYIDDFLAYGLSLEEIYESTESFLVGMSHFRLLVQPKKVKLVSKCQSFLGYAVSMNKIVRVTKNKITDLKDIPTPRNKDDLRSLLGLLAWFSGRAFLRDSTRRMREMCKSGNRFRWSDELEGDLRKSIEIILCPITGCLRPPITASDCCPFVMFIDSSRHHYGGVLCQMQPVGEKEMEREGLKENVHRLYLLEYYAKAIPQNQLLVPIALLELESLFLCLKHWKAYLLGGSKFICYSDSRYVSYWYSLELCSEKVARWLQFISEFSIEIRFIPSELNQADVISRKNKEEGKTPVASNPFMSVAVRNAQGEVVPVNQLFSKDKRAELNGYFERVKRGQMARIMKLEEWVEGEETALGKSDCISGRDTESAPSFPEPETAGAQALLSVQEKFEHCKEVSSRGTSCNGHDVGLPLVGAVMAVNRVGRGLGVRKKDQKGGPFESNEVTDEGQEASKGNGEGLCPLMDNVLGMEKGDIGVITKPKGREKARKRRKARRREERELLGSVEEKECVLCECGGWAISDTFSTHCTCVCSPLMKIGEVEACGFVSTRDQLDGMAELGINDPFVDVRLPEIHVNDLERVKEGQGGEKGKLLKKWINDGKVPNSNESLNLSTEVLSVLRHFSLFKLNDQGVLFRLFVTADGTVWPLILTEGESTTRLVKEIHESLGHGSKKAVFEIMSKRYYDTGLRRKIDEALKDCVICLKYNIPKTVKSKQSTLLASYSRQVLQMDLLGPLPISHGYRYIWAGCDAWDRSCYIRALKGTTALEMGELMAKFFGEQGKWEFVKIDSKCLSLKGVDKILMDKMGVGIIRSNHCSRHQGMVERLLQTILIKLLKFLDSDTRLDGWFPILGKLEFLINSLPHRGLGMMTPNEVRYRRPPSLAVPPFEVADLGSEKGEFKSLVRISSMIRRAAFKGLIQNKSYYRVDESLTKGQLVWRKRQSFARNMNKKLQFKVIEAYEIMDRVGTGLYKVRNVETKEMLVLPVDQLIKCRLNREEVMKVLNEIKQ